MTVWQKQQLSYVGCS